MTGVQDWFTKRSRALPRTATLKAVDDKQNVLASVTVNGNDVELAGIELLQDVESECVIQSIGEDGAVLASFPFKPKAKKAEPKKDKSHKIVNDKLVKLVGDTFEATATHNEKNFDRAYKLLEREDNEIGALRAELAVKDVRILELTIENMSAKHAIELEAAKGNADSGAFKEHLASICKEAAPHLPEIFGGIAAMWAAKTGVEGGKKIDEKAADPVTVVAENDNPSRAERVRRFMKRLPDDAVDKIVMAIFRSKTVTESVMKTVGPFFRDDGPAVKRLIDDYTSIEG